MGVNFENGAMSEFMEWVNEDRKTAQKIYKLIMDIQRNGLDKGLGKPEHLKYSDGWSRRIDHGNRLVYKIGQDGNIIILSCKGHYDD